LYFWTSSINFWPFSKCSSILFSLLLFFENIFDFFVFCLCGDPKMGYNITYYWVCHLQENEKVFILPCLRQYLRRWKMNLELIKSLLTICNPLKVGYVPQGLEKWQGAFSRSSYESIEGNQSPYKTLNFLHSLRRSHILYGLKFFFLLFSSIPLKLTIKPMSFSPLMAKTYLGGLSFIWW